MSASAWWGAQDRAHLNSVRIWIALNAPINSGEIDESEFGELRCSIRINVWIDFGNEQPSRSWSRLFEENPCQENCIVTEAEESWFRMLQRGT
jgi:hypothetical protein